MSAPRLFVVSIAYKLNSRTDKTFIVSSKAVLATDPASARTRALEGECRDVIFAIRVQDQGEALVADVSASHVNRNFVETSPQWERLSSEISGGF